MNRYEQYRAEARRKMSGDGQRATKGRAGQFGHISAKLIACLLIVACLAVGAIGILLPIVPGLLFLAVAAILLARHFPFTERWMRRNSTMRGYLDSAEGFSGLDWLGRIRYGALLCAKILIDSVEFCASLSARFLDRASDTWSSYRATGRSR